MGKGGDTTTSSTTSELPAYAAPYVNDLLSSAQTAKDRPYVQYEGQRLADFSTDTNDAFGMVRDNAAAGTPGLDAAMDTTGGIAGYQAGNIPGMDVDAYMNPYVENVLDVQKNRMNQNYQEQQAGRDAQAVSAGAFGGDRRFVSDSLAQRDHNEQLQNTEATGLASAYDRATGLFHTDETNRRLGSALGLDAARQQGALGVSKGDVNLRNAEALSGVGSKFQQREQAGFDLANQDFANQRDYPNQQLAMYSQLLSGTPITPQTTTSVTEPAPDFLSQLIGAATTGIGAYNLFNQ